MSIGKVTINQNRNTTVKIKTGGQTSIVNPNYAVSVNISMADIKDVSTANLENGYVITYNSITNKYETKPIESANVSVPFIIGGIF
jgi:hypothetical protein